MASSSSGVDQQDQIVCVTCSRRFRYKPELAGRTVKCPCGAVIMVRKPEPKPQAAPAAAGGHGGAEADPFANVDWNGYDIADEPAPPAKPAAAAAVAPVGLGAPAGAADAPAPGLARVMHDLPPQRKGLTPEARKTNEELVPPSAVRDVVVPTILIVVGVFLRFYESTSPAATQTPLAFGAALGDVGMKLALSVGLMIGMMFLAVSILEVSFVGPLPRVAYKLAAIGIGPGALYGILSFAGGEMYGSMIGTFVSIAVYFLLFWLLMRLDMKDTGMCVLMTWILVTAANYIAYRVQGMMRDSWI